MSWRKTKAEWESN